MVKFKRTFGKTQKRDFLKYLGLMHKGRSEEKKVSHGASQLYMGMFVSV